MGNTIPPVQKLNYYDVVMSAKDIFSVLWFLISTDRSYKWTDSKSVILLSSDTMKGLQESENLPKFLKFFKNGLYNLDGSKLFAICE